MLVMARASPSLRPLGIGSPGAHFNSEREAAVRHLIVTSLLGSAVLAAASSVCAQATNASDMTNPIGHAFSRRFAERAIAAMPAPPELISTEAILNAMCGARADALLMFALIKDTDEAARMAAALLKGGAGAAQVARPLYDRFVAAGADATAVNKLIDATNGLLLPERPTVAAVDDAVSGYNAVVSSAPDAFLDSPPAEFVALRTALGRLTYAANRAYDPTHVFPGFMDTSIGYATDAPAVLSRETIMIGAETYKQF